jgi:hypothetical protein
MHMFVLSQRLMVLHEFFCFMAILVLIMSYL